MGSVAALRTENYPGARTGCSAPYAGADADRIEMTGRYVYKHFRRLDGCEHEATILRQLAPHPHVTELIGADLLCGVLCFRREPIDLMRLLLGGARPPPVALSLSLLSALAHCHRAGLVHRDVKPENILVNQCGEAVLCDFGRSRFAPEPLRLPFAGTHAYAAPEALEGLCCVANDVWSGGVVLFCATEALMPFEEEDEGEVQQDRRVASATKSAALRPEFDDSCWNLSPFHRCLRGVVAECLIARHQARPKAQDCHARLERQQALQGAKDDRPLEYVSAAPYVSA